MPADRMKALRIANEVRERRKELKADLRNGRVVLADVLFSDAAYLRTMKVRDLLLATPGIGKHKANRALQVCWISPTAPLARMSPRSRSILLEWLAEKHPSVELGWPTEQEAAA